LVIDLQEKFAPVIHDWDSVLGASTRLIRFFHLLQAPIVVTEQYPKGLGKTVRQIRDSLGDSGFSMSEKMLFSACETAGLKQVIRKKRRRQWIVCGIESHVCVQQTALDMRDSGLEVFLAVDAVGSRHPTDRYIALERMTRAGAILSTSESLIFEILRDARHPLFKRAAAIVR